MRAFVYTRQSSDRSGHGLAVARQLEDCLKLVDQRGWELVGQREDNDQSAAGKRKRPGFEATMEAVEEGQVDVVVAWALDRLTRNARERIRLVESCKAASTSLALVRGSDYDLTTPAGRFSIGILGEVAQMEIDQKSDRQIRAQRQAAEQGRSAGGRRPFGYMSDGTEVDWDEAELIIAGYKHLLTGASLKSIARGWNESGWLTTAGNPWRHDNVREVLKNPRYAGLRTYRGEVVGPAKWPSLVDLETHAAAVALLSLPERRTTMTTARKYLLPGLALCWKCGSDVATGHTRHNKRVYTCRANKCISRAAQPVDDLVEGVVIARLERPDAVALLETQVPTLREDRAMAEAIRQRLDDLAVGLEEGILTLGAVRTSSDRLKKELSLVEAKIHDSARADVLTPLLNAPDVAKAWETRDLKQRRAVVNALMTITLLAPKRGRQEFDPDTVRIDWKGVS